MIPASRTSSLLYSFPSQVTPVFVVTGSSIISLVNGQMKAWYGGSMNCVTCGNIDRDSLRLPYFLWLLTFVLWLGISGTSEISGCDSLSRNILLHWLYHRTFTTISNFSILHLI